MKKLITVIAVLFVMSTPAFADVNAITPSTNDINRDNGWAHVNQINKGVGTTDLQFVSTRAFWSCFEYRVDDEPNTVAGANPNIDITDGRWTQVCVNNSTQTKTIIANEYVDVRMVYGAEKDERFDWTRFEVLYPRMAEITSPSVDEEVWGMVNFSAYLDDDDVDAIQWAVRQGTCTAGANTVLGNVDGHSDVAVIDTSDTSNQTFFFTGDMSLMAPGMYCFIYNPVEDSGESGIRMTREFTLLMPPPSDMNQCKKGGWETFTNPTFKNQGACVSYVQSNENAGKRD